MLHDTIDIPVTLKVFCLLDRNILMRNKIYEYVLNMISEKMHVSVLYINYSALQDYSQIYNHVVTSVQPVSRYLMPTIPP